MTINDIKTPEDILDFMNEHIRYGWLDINGEEHINTMKEFRRLYRTSSIDECLEHRLGVCTEQVYLMHKLLDKINNKKKMSKASFYYLNY